MSVLTPDLDRYFNRYRDDEFALIGIGLHNIAVVNRGTRELDFNLPGRLPDIRLNNVPRTVLQVTVRVLLASTAALASEANEDTRPLEALLSFYIEPVLDLKLTPRRSDLNNNRLEIRFLPVERNRSLIVSLVSPTPLAEIRQAIPGWPSDTLNELDLTLVVSQVRSLSDKFRAAIADLQPVDVRFDTLLPQLPGLDPAVVNLGFRYVEDDATIYLRAQLEDRGRFFSGLLPGFTNPDDAAYQVQGEWERFYLGTPPSWRGVAGSTVSAGVSFDELAAAARGYLPGVLREVLSSVTVFDSLIRVDGVSIQSDSSAGSTLLGINATLPNYGIGTDLRFHLEALFSLSEQPHEGSQAVMANLEVRAHLNTGDLTDVAASGGLMRLLHASARSCSGESPDGEEFLGVLTGLAQLVATVAYPITAIVIRANSDFFDSLVAKSVVNSLMRAIAGTARCADDPNGWVALDEFVSALRVWNTLAIRVLAERALRSLSDRLAQGSARGSLFGNLMPLTLATEVRSGSVALGLTPAHARDGIVLLREAAAGRLTISQSAQFRYPNDCAQYLEFNVWLRNPTPLAVVVSLPVVTGTTAMSRAVARDGWLTINGDDSRRFNDLGRIAASAPGASRRWWVVPPSASIQLRFVITEETARAMAALSGQEQTFRYVILTSVGVFPHEVADPLAMFALTDTEEGRQNRYDGCIRRVAGQRGSAPAQGPRMGRELVDQFIRERIESRYILGAGGTRLDAPGLVPLPGGGGLPTPVDPQPQPWESGVPLPATGFDASPGVFALLMESVSQRK